MRTAGKIEQEATEICQSVFDKEGFSAGKKCREEYIAAAHEQQNASKEEVSSELHPSIKKKRRQKIIIASAIGIVMITGLIFYFKKRK